MHEKSPFTFQVMIIMMTLMMVRIKTMTLKMMTKMIYNALNDHDNCENDDGYGDDAQDFFKQRKRWMQGIYLVCRFHAIITTITT